MVSKVLHGSSDSRDSKAVDRVYAEDKDSNSYGPSISMLSPTAPQGLDIYIHMMEESKLSNFPELIKSCHMVRLHDNLR